MLSTSSIKLLPVTGPALGWQLHCHPRGDSTTVAPTTGRDFVDDLLVPRAQAGVLKRAVFGDILGGRHPGRNAVTRSLLFSTAVLMFLANAALAAEPPVRRENIEWCNIWIPDATRTDLPRVLLIGDSICNGYHTGVEKALQGKGLVAMLATSSALGDPPSRSRCNCFCAITSLP